MPAMRMLYTSEDVKALILSDIKKTFPGFKPTKKHVRVFGCGVLKISNVMDFTDDVQDNSFLYEVDCY